MKKSLQPQKRNVHLIKVNQIKKIITLGKNDVEVSPALKRKRKSLYKRNTEKKKNNASSERIRKEKLQH